MVHTCDQPAVPVQANAAAATQCHPSVWIAPARGAGRWPFTAILLAMMFPSGPIHGQASAELLSPAGVDGRATAGPQSHHPSTHIADGVWSVMDLGPTGRKGHSAIYDPVRDRLIVFGGVKVVSPSVIRLNDVWALSMSGTPTWTELTPIGVTPPERTLHTAIYDPIRDRMIVFGGSANGGAYLNDVWELTLSGTPTWTQLAPVSGPPRARGIHSAVYDPVRDQMIVFGGVGRGQSTVQLGDAWSLTLSSAPTWTLLSDAGPLRYAHAAIFDPVFDRMVMFGGVWDYDPGHEPRERVYYNDVWELDLSGVPIWTPLTPTGTPPIGRANHSAIYDPSGARMLVFGGSRDYEGTYLDDVWALDLSGGAEWSALTPPESPIARAVHAATYDPSRHQMIVFGGEYYGHLFDDVWALTVTGTPTWNALTVGSNVAPEAHTSIYDPLRDRMVVFGVNHVGPLSGLSAFELSEPPEWVRLPSAGTPPPWRLEHTAIYDPNGDRMVVFGGSGSNYLNDLWVLTLSGTPIWERVTPFGGPPLARHGHSAIYDPLRGRMVVFGGYLSNGVRSNDVWELTLSGTPTWSELFPDGSAPRGRAHHTATYDPVRDRMVVFGGEDPGTLGDVWILTLFGTPKWEEVAPAGTPPVSRSSHTAIYDPMRDRVVVFGGYNDGAGFQNDAWALTMKGASSWNELSPGGPLPSDRYRHTAIYDPVRDQMVVFGGNGPDKTVWALTWGDATTSTLLSLVSAKAEPGFVRVTWQAGEERDLTAMVYRRTNEDVWTAVGAIATDGMGRMVYEDSSVLAGVQYGYRLGIVREGVEEFLGEAWVAVPKVPEFALAGLRPNPAQGSLSVAFSLPDGSSARLELLDLAGRSVIIRDVGALGRGAHVIEMGRGQTVAPGVYFLRLSGPNGSLTTRAVVVH